MLNPALYLFFFQGSAAPSTEPTPTGGWAFQFYRETAEQRRRERERLGIEPREQKKIDRAATKILKTLPEGLNVSRETLIQAVMAAPQFDALLMALRPSEGMAAALAEAILLRVQWITEQQRLAEEDEAMALVRVLLEL